MSSRSVGQRLLRAGKWLGVIVAGVVLIVASAVAFVLSSPNLVRGPVNDALSGAFEGRLSVERIGSWSPDGLRGVNLLLRDPSGRKVAAAWDVSIDVSWGELLTQLTDDDQKLVIRVGRLDVGSLHVDLGTNPDGQLRLAQALTTPDAGPPSDQSKVDVRVFLEESRFQSAWLYASYPPSRPPAVPLDVGLEDARLAFRLHDSTLFVDQFSAQARARRPAWGLGEAELDLSGSLKFADRPSESAPPWAGLESQLTLDVESDAGRIHVEGTQRGANLDVAGEVTVAPSLARRHGVNLDNPANIDFEARGTFDRMDVLLVATSGEAKVDAELVVQPTQGFDIEGKVGVVNVSPQLAGVADVSEIDAALEFDVRKNRDRDPGLRGWEAHVEGAVQPVQWGDKATPPLDFEAHLQEGRARLVASTRGKGPSRLEASAALGPDGQWGDVRVQGRVRSAHALKYLPTVRGTGQVEFEGLVSTQEQTVDGSFSLELADVRVEQGPAVERLRGEGSIRGELSDPSVRLDVQAQGVEASGRRMERVDARIEGKLGGAKVQAELQRNDRKTRLSATIDATGQEIEVGDVAIRSEQPGQDLDVAAEQITVKGDRIEFNSVRFSGVGTSEISGALTPQGVRLEGFVRDVPVSRLEDLLAMELPLSGVIDLDVDFELGDGRSEGRVRAVLTDFGLAPHVLDTDLPPADVRLDVVGMGDRLALWVDGELVGPDGAERPQRVFLATEMRTPKLKEWERPDLLWDEVTSARGRFDLDVAEFSSFVPNVKVSQGRLSGRFSLQRESQEHDPSFDLTLRGQHLGGVFGTPAEDEDSSAAQLLLADWGVVVRAHSSPASGRVEFAVQVNQHRREWVSLELTFEESVAALLRDGGAGVLAAPLRAHVVVPRLRLENLPAQLRPPGWEGTLKGDAKIEGSLREPRGRVTLEASEWGPIASNESTPARLSGEIEARYDGSTAEWDLDLESPVAEAQIKSQGSLALSGSPLDHLSPESLQGQLSVKQFPLQLLPALARRGVQGPLDLDLQVVDWGSPEERVTLDVLLGQVMIDEISLAGASAQVEFRDGQARGRAKLNERGYVVEAEGASSVERDGFFGVRPGQTQEGELHAKGVPVGLFQPLLGRSVAGLEGKLAAQARIERTGESREFQASASVRDGAVQLPSLGQRLRDINFDAVWTDGDRLVIEEATLRGTSGRGTLSVDAQMGGFFPESGSVRFAVDRGERLPVSLAGMGMGEFWGALTTHFEIDREESRIVTETEMEQFHLRFPELPTDQVQSLESADSIKVGTRLESERFLRIPLQPVKEEKRDDPWTLHSEFELGSEFWLAQGPLRRVQVTGNLELEVAGDVAVSGAISLARGQFELNGRQFEVHSGTVTFQPDDPGNPIIVAEAHWESREGILVIAQFTGPAKSGEMTLRSEPPLPNDQVVSLLLFGDTSGLNEGAGGGGSAKQAAVVGGSVATTGINKALNRYKGIDLTTRVRGANDNVRPEVVVQLTNSLSAQVGYNLEEPTPGNSPDRTLLTFELRLVGGSALSMTVGDHGTTLLDWVWRYRY